MSKHTKRSATSTHSLNSTLSEHLKRSSNKLNEQYKDMHWDENTNLGIDDGMIEVIEEMAIKMPDGEKLTARQMAQEIMYDAIVTYTNYWSEGQYGFDKMTSKEKGEVNKQLDKYRARFKKTLGFK